jgi:hypothetical protein
VRAPSEDDRQMASFVLLDKTISALDRLTAMRIQRGDRMPAEDLEYVQQLAQRCAIRRKHCEA